MSELRPQRRGRRIAMTTSERDAFLHDQRTCRIATMGADGPHATPLWFVWDGAALWLYSLSRSRRWADLRRDPRAGAVVDAGVEYLELRGVELSGEVDVVGDVPRTNDAPPTSDLRDAERAFARKYFASDDMFHDGKHGWLRLTPSKIVSWDFRKLAG